MHERSPSLGTRWWTPTHAILVLLSQTSDIDTADVNLTSAAFAPSALAIAHLCVHGPVLKQGLLRHTQASP
eukprot:6796770-Heterocapsa_arctica.AAC.1